jgi:hypothetical protein
MKIFQFIAEYCQDLVEESRRAKSLIDLSEFPHDGFAEDVEGNKVPVVYIDGESVPVSDFFTMDKSDFVNIWKLPNAGNTYDEYTSVMEILEGAEALNRIRNTILAEQERLATDVELVSSI